MTAHGRALAACEEAFGRATQDLELVTKAKFGPFTIALNLLTLGRVSLYRALLGTPVPDAAGPEPRRPGYPASVTAAKQHLDAAVEGLRRAGTLDLLPRALLTRAWLHHLLGNPPAATTDLDETESLATRGPMPIFLADAHLTRARLFRDRTELGKAKELLATLATKGYHRHDQMLADTEQSAKHWSEPV